MTTTTMISFITHCPHCKMEVLPFVEPTQLLAELEMERASFYCISCDYHWKPELQERRQLTTYVKQSIVRCSVIRATRAIGHVQLRS